MYKYDESYNRFVRIERTDEEELMEFIKKLTNEEKLILLEKAKELINAENEAEVLPH